MVGPVKPPRRCFETFFDSSPFRGRWRQRPTRILRRLISLIFAGWVPH